MTRDSWIIDSVGAEKVAGAATEATRRRLLFSLDMESDGQLPDQHLRFVADALQLRVFDLLDSEDEADLRTAAAEAFQVARVLPRSAEPLAAAEFLVRTGCLGILGERAADVRRILSQGPLPPLPTGSEDWGMRVHSTILDTWLRLLRKDGWDDLDAVASGVASLRTDQRSYEPEYLRLAQERQDARPAWELIAAYHLAKAAELLGTYQAQGSVDQRYDIREQLQAQFDRAISAAQHGLLMEQETLTRLLARTSQSLVDSSIWTVTRAVNSRVGSFVEAIASRQRRRPIFEMLPPQRRTLREEGLLGSGHRSVVVSLPTSSGKTLIAQFRILQALNQFDDQRGWVAYVAPTRALVNQLTLRLRRDFAGLGISVERLSPALEVDGLEAGMLAETHGERQFRVLVTTPEKLDMMLRGDWERKIGRPLTLVVVDEAHGIASGARGMRLELLLATINRECRHAQFLLLTPFVPNSEEIARWLSPDSNKSIEVGVDWVPNDRVIALARAQRGRRRGEFSVHLKTLHTSRNTIEVPEAIEIGKRPLELSWSDVSDSPGKLAAATAQALRSRGTVIALVAQPRHSWGVAEAFKVEGNRAADKSEDMRHIQRFLSEEMGPDFPLGSLLDYGIGVHHSGLSDDTRTIVEWLAERGELNVLVATTTIAQGVNFPVSGLVFATHQYPYGQDMPPEDFWNIAGRAGRVDQSDIGVIALAANTDEREADLTRFVGRSVDALNSTLIGMVQEVQRLEDGGDLLNLEKLAWRPEWSAFLQYLAHTYRQIGDHERFAHAVEQVLRGTLGFQALRRSNRAWSDQLVAGVYNYAERIKGQPLTLVDATGFSWETVSSTLGRLSRAQVTGEIWSPEIFGTRRDDLRRMVGVMLEVPELRQSLKQVTGGDRADGDTISRIICDWVQGRSLEEMATEYFGGNGSAGEDATPDRRDSVSAMTRCCRSIFGNLAQTASWGLAALQSLTIGDEFDSLSADEQLALRNLPARVYYGVNSDEAVALRLLGVPRAAATPLARRLGVRSDEPLHEVRVKVRAAGADRWAEALGDRGTSYHRVWSIIEGEI